MAQPRAAMNGIPGLGRDLWPWDIGRPRSLLPTTQHAPSTLFVIPLTLILWFFLADVDVQVGMWPELQRLFHYSVLREGTIVLPDYEKVLGVGNETLGVAFFVLMVSTYSYFGPASKINPEHPLMSYVPTKRNKQIVDNFLEAIPPFKPTSWAANGHAQSVLFAYWPLPVTLSIGKYDFQYMREFVTFEDGGMNALDWYEFEGLPEDAPIVFALPGVIGESKNPYLKRFIVQAAEDLKWRSVVKSWRGINCPMTNPTPETWSVQTVEDMKSCVQHVRKKYPKAPILGYGFSFGGQVLQAYLGAYPEDSGMIAGVSVSGLFDAGKIYDATSAWSFPPYDRSLTLGIKRHLANHLDTLKEARGSNLVEQLGTISNLYEFHDIVTRHFVSPPAPSTAEYFRRVQGDFLPLLRHIKTPILCLMADDDPLCPNHVVEPAAAAVVTNEHVFIARTAQGGHCGWFHGPSGASWLDEAVIAFLKPFTEDIKKTTAGLQAEISALNCE